MTRSGVMLGTPQYMPPEQAHGILDQIDARSDVYSLGATLYEMLSLSPPFEGATALEIMQKGLILDPKSPRRLNPAAGPRPDWSGPPLRTTFPRKPSYAPTRGLPP